MLRLPEYAYHRPISLEEALRLLDEHAGNVLPIAGGTDAIPNMKHRLLTPAHLVSLKGLPELRGIEVREGELRIGAAETLATVSRHPLVLEHAPALARAAGLVAGPQLRNMGTIGGNLVQADPAEDPPSTLLALNASVKLQSKNGERIVPLSEFFQDYYETAIEPGEILTEIQVPALPAGAGTAHYKFLPRSRDDYATVGIAVVLTLDADKKVQDIRIGMNSVGPTPMRATRAEQILTGQQLTDEVLNEAAQAASEDVDPISDIRGSSDYKREMVKVWVRRTVRQAAAALA